MKRLNAIFFHFALGVFGNLYAAEAPNILLILADDLGYSDLGSYGGEIDTPNLDRLAADGLRFSQFYNTGRCWPTRASLMTGLYPHQANHGMIFGQTAPRGYQGTRKTDGLMISEILKPAGYRTYQLGKWHLGKNRPKLNDTWPLARGFDHSYLAVTLQNYHNPALLYDDTQAIKRPGGPAPMGDGSYYLTSALTDRTIAYLKEHATDHPDKPFFIYLAYTAPHFPLHALPEDIDRFRGRYRKGWDTVRQERHERMEKLGLVKTGLSPRDPDARPWESLTSAEKDSWDTRMAIYAAMIYRMDIGVGRIVEQLKKMDAFENTLILFLSDNGSSAEYIVRGDRHDPNAPPGSGGSYLCLEVGWSNASNTPLRMHKSWVHEGGIATPLIAHWPDGIAARGAITHQTGHVIDILPTIADLADALIPEEYEGHALPRSPGKSLAPVFQGRQRAAPDFLFWEHIGNKAIRKGDWKLVKEHNGPWELYNLDTDRSEVHDLSGSHPGIVDALAGQWEGYAEKTGVVEWDSFPQSKIEPGKNYRRK